MPYRKTPIVSGEIYHVFNRSIARQHIFLNQRDYQRAIETIDFYRYRKLPLRFSHFNRLALEQKQEFINNHMRDSKPMLEIFAYCIMPNHIHFLLRQILDHSISDFMRNFQHSYSKYFNTKRERTGSLFQSMFKAVRVESDEQLLHVSRYIHLNPVTAYIIKIDDLIHYPWCSFKDYIESFDNSLVNTKVIMEYFKSQEEYKKFVFDQVKYQKSLVKIEHLLLE